MSSQNYFSYVLIHESPRCFLPSLKSICLSVQKNNRKIEFQDGRHDSHSGFPIGIVLAIFDLQVTSILPTKFKSVGLLFRRRSET